MTRPENRLQLMDRLGAQQANTVWAWCGVDHDKRRVYFSVWTDLTVKDPSGKKYIIQEPHWGINEFGHHSPARNDHDEKLGLIFENDYEPFGYFVEAKDTTAKPREIARTLTSFVMRLGLEKLANGSVVGEILERTEIR